MADNASGSRSYRFVEAAFGLLFAGLAITVIVVSDRTAGPLLGAAVLGLLGVDAIVSAIRNKRSLVSRIGPLP